MSMLTGTIKNGHVVLDTPAVWPEGFRVQVKPLSAVEFGMTEEEQGDDPESIARWIAAFNAIPPLEMTPEEEAEWSATHQAQKDYEKSQFDAHAKEIESLFP